MREERERKLPPARCTCTITGSSYERPWDGTEPTALALTDEAADDTAYDGAEPPWGNPGPINNHGQAVGLSYVTRGDHGVRHAVLWTER